MTEGFFIYWLACAAFVAYAFVEGRLHNYYAMVAMMLISFAVVPAVIVWAIFNKERS